MSEQAERMVEWGFKTLVGVLFAIVGWFGIRAFEQLSDHGDRITRVEASSVKSTEVNQLSVAIAQLVTSRERDREEQRELAQEIRELRAELSKR